MYKFIPISSGGQTDDLAALVDRVEAGMDQGLLPVDVFCDDAVFRAEMVRIFGQAWVFLGHETEIPKAGDFVSARFTEDGEWYRARIRRNDREAKKVEVVYVDVI